MTKPQLIVVIGANGAGKTTWARRHRTTLPKPFYNADWIAEGLGDANDRTMQEAARHIVDEQIEADLSQARTFGFESTYSGHSRPNIVRRAKNAGYTTGAIFIGTEDARINISRVAKRVEEGGHDVAEHEVKRRWSAALANLLDTWDAFDTIRVLDSSGTEPIEIALKSGPGARTISTFPQWAQAIAERTTEPARTAGREK